MYLRIYSRQFIKASKMNERYAIQVLSYQRKTHDGLNMMWMDEYFIEFKTVDIEIK